MGGRCGGKEIIVSTNELRLLGTVLCGGQSRRMGREKATLPHNRSGTFWRHAIDQLSPLCNQVCLAGKLSTATDQLVLADQTRSGGPACGVASALQHACCNSFDAVFITPVDMPLLKTDDLKCLYDLWQEHRHQIVAAVSGTENRLEPLVAIYPTQFATALETLSNAEDRSLYRWISGQPHLCVPLPTNSCRNMNTPEDLQRGSQVSL